MRLISVSGNYAATIYDEVILVNASVSGVTVTLPLAVNAGQARLTVKKTDSSTNLVTISGGVDLIDGSASKVISFQHDSYTLVSDGDNYFLI